MKIILALIATALIGCGSEPSKTSSADANINVIKLDVRADACEKTGWVLTLLADLSDNPAGWDVAFTYQLASLGDAPVCTAANSSDSGGDGFIHPAERFAFETAYSFRACAWNQGKNTYTAGVVKTVTMPPITN